eukprot:SAG11_NODE_33108_length_279_cov_0.577778_1_plen_61_part_10
MHRDFLQGLDLEPMSPNAPTRDEEISALEAAERSMRDIADGMAASSSMPVAYASARPTSSA